MKRLTRDRLAAAQALFNTLLTPLSPHLSHRTLVIVPHHVLHYLSFAPSASALSYAQANRNPDQGHLLALGNPTTDLPPLPMVVTPEAAVGSVVGEAGQGGR